MSYLVGDYSPSDTRYGEACSPCYAFITQVDKSGDLQVSTITLYANLAKDTPIFSFNVGTLDDSEASIWEAAKQAYIPGFALGT